MSKPNHKQRRSRWFCAEALERRELLSTAGLVSRPPAAVAPLPRFALSSAIPELTISASLIDDGRLFPKAGGKTGEARAGGSVEVPEFGGIKPSSEFFLQVDYSVVTGGLLKFEKGYATLMNTAKGGMHGHRLDLLKASSFKWVNQGHNFVVEGDVTSGRGKFENAKGTFSATGTFDTTQPIRTNVYAFSINFTFHLTRV
jgi:hypothetical protein